VHRRPRLTLVLSVVALVVVAVAATVLTVWRSRVLDVATPSGGADPACARMAAALPDRVRGQDRVRTTSSSPAVAAWGRPAVVWRCGVTPPGPTTDECLAVDGVDWVVHRLSDGAAFTTYGRDPAVQVLVPKGSSPEPLVLPVFDRAVRLVPQGDHRCS
jgi:hypothetical protein